MKTTRVDATPLLEEIEAYCDRTGTEAGWIGKLAFNHPGYVPLIRKRGVTSLEAATRVRTVLQEYPDGIPQVALLRARLNDMRSPVGRRKAEEALTSLLARRAQMEAMPRVSRDPCRVCGARGDIECGHRKGTWGTSYG